MKDPERPMAHSDEGEILAWMDEQLSSLRAAEVEEHVRGCEACSAVLRDLQGAAAALGHGLSAGDRPIPRGSTLAVRRRALRRRLIRPLPAAAVLVLVFATGALAMVPGSPLRSWIAARNHRASASPAVPPTAALVTRLSVVSPDSIDIVVGEPRDTLDVQLVRSAGLRIEVETERAHALERLELGNAQLRIYPGTARRLRIRFPRVDRVRVLLGGRNLLSSASGVQESGPSGEDSITSVRIAPTHAGQERP